MVLLIDGRFGICVAVCFWYYLDAFCLGYFWLVVLGDLCSWLCAWIRVRCFGVVVLLCVSGFICCDVCVDLCVALCFGWVLVICGCTLA